MKKIVIIVGSNRKHEKSNSYKIAQIVKNKLEKCCHNYICNIICLSDYHISYCEGCMNCFYRGKCVIDDELKEVQKEMIDAIHVMFVSPVYVHGVPGIMKNFIDRLAFWTHIFQLLGKTSSSITVASSNGLTYVSDYQKKILELLGTIYIDGFDLTVDQPPMFLKEKDLEIFLNIFIDNIINGIENELDIRKIEHQSGTFELYKKRYSQMDTQYFESATWNSDEALMKNTFLEAYRYRRKVCAEK